MHNEEQQTNVSGFKHIELEEHQRKGSVQFKEVDIYKLGRLKTASGSEKCTDPIIPVRAV